MKLNFHGIAACVIAALALYCAFLNGMRVGWVNGWNLAGEIANRPEIPEPAATESKAEASTNDAV